MLGMLAGTAGAAEYQEQGNAGDVPGTAQSTAGPVPTPLDAITGEISDDMDQDMFKIVVTDPVTFSASTNNPETVPSDTMLYLFDATGHGVLATDDIDGLNWKSTLAAGSLDAAGGGAGVYYVAISKSFNVPVSNTPPAAANEIFLEADLAGTSATIGANGAGAANPVVAWWPFPFDADTGAYRINLTGATFAETATAVPAMAPGASVGLSLLLGACGIGALRIRFSRKELGA
jgi:hypothetical protein